MARTRSQASGVASQATETQRTRTSRVALKRSHKKPTPAQQSIARHNRFLVRVWKVPWSERMQHTKCVACLGDFFETTNGSNYFGVMACDHVIHLGCMVKHADAHLDRHGVYSLDDLEGLSEGQVATVCETRSLYRRLGAPCPACRMEFPMRHMAVFSNGCPRANVPRVLE